jgi:serine/threonine protein phosphatase PrpC
VQAVHWGARTDIGSVRQRNEDAFLAQEPVFVVADGMGGHVGGATASAVAVAEFQRLVDGADPTSETVAEAVARSNDAILRLVDGNPDLAGMGTTLVGIVLVTEGGQTYWLGFNIGDSRLYRFLDGELTRLSHDHSVVQELLESGDITVDEIPFHQDRNVVTRALGSDPEPVADYWLLAPHDGERFLLCSDGLTGEVPESRIAAVLSEQGDPQLAASMLVAEALDAGGRDNVTAVVIQTGTAESNGQGWLSADTIERPLDAAIDRELV